MSAVLKTFAMLGVMAVFSPLYALSVDPAAPVVYPGTTFTLTAGDYTGGVNWLEVSGNRFLGIGERISYTAPLQTGTYQIQASDVYGSVTVEVTVMPVEMESENATWEVLIVMRFERWPCQTMSRSYGWERMAAWNNTTPRRVFYSNCRVYHQRQRHPAGDAARDGGA